MPAAVAIPLITGGIGAITSIAGAKKAADTSTRVAKTQSDTAQKAMDYSQQSTDKVLQYLMGQQSGIRNPMTSSPAYMLMSKGLNLPTTGMATGYAPQFQPGYATATPPNAAATPPVGAVNPYAPGASQATVLMEAPDGSQQAVPREKVAMFQAKGARIVPMSTGTERSVRSGI